VSQGAPRVGGAAFALALLVGATPLWSGRQLPMVDLPQHLHLISVLHRLDDPTTLYPRLFVARGELTPYLGYYHLVSGLNWLLPLELANRLFLTLMVTGLPLAMAFLLRALGRPRWPAALTLPFAYGDSFGWGFVNSNASFVLALVAAALFLRSLTDVAWRTRWAVAHGAILIAVLLMHVQGFGFLALALPWLLFTTRVPDSERGWWRPRFPTVLSALPAVGLFAVWGAGRLLAPAQVEEGAPWKAWGPLLSQRNLAWKPLAQNLDEFPRVLANLVRDGSDRWGLRAVTAVAILGMLLWIVGQRAPWREGPLERWRLPGLAVIAFALFLALPFDIRGAVYYLNTRYAHLAAPLMVASVPPLSARLRPWLLGLAAVSALVLAVPLGSAFRTFDGEAAPLLRFAEETPAGPRIMGLIFDSGSRVMSHPVFLHAASVPARLRGGITNFSFALTPHSPLRYRSTPPPTFPSEWRPDGFRWETMGPAYTHFLVRGVSPQRIFGPRLGTEVTPVDAAGEMSWLARNTAATAQESRTP
jgi:hypothetical protein